MIFITKYDVGNTVFFKGMADKPTYQSCPRCAGESMLFRRDKSMVKCDRCNGEGTVTFSGSTVEVVRSGTVKDVRAYSNGKIVEFEYTLDGEKIDPYNRFREGELYSNADDVEALFIKGAYMGYNKATVVDGSL